VKVSSPPVTATQLAVVRQAASRPSQALEPLPAKIRGAARQSVLNALLSRGYAAKCFFPGHVEYVLTNAGAAIGTEPTQSAGSQGLGTAATGALLSREPRRD